MDVPCRAFGHADAAAFAIVQVDDVRPPGSLLEDGRVRAKMPAIVAGHADATTEAATGFGLRCAGVHAGLYFAEIALPRARSNLGLGAAGDRRVVVQMKRFGGGRGRLAQVEGGAGLQISLDVFSGLATTTDGMGGRSFPAAAVTSREHAGRRVGAQRLQTGPVGLLSGRHNHTADRQEGFGAGEQYRTKPPGIVDYVVDLRQLQAVQMGPAADQPLDALSDEQSYAFGFGLGDLGRQGCHLFGRLARPAPGAILRRYDGHLRRAQTSGTAGDINGGITTPDHRDPIRQGGALAPIDPTQKGQPGLHAVPVELGLDR